MLKYFRFEIHIFSHYYCPWQELPNLLWAYWYNSGSVTDTKFLLLFWLESISSPSWSVFIGTNQVLPLSSTHSHCNLHLDTYKHIRIGYMLVNQSELKLSRNKKKEEIRIKIFGQNVKCLLGYGTYCWFPLLH